MILIHVTVLFSFTPGTRYEKRRTVLVNCTILLFGVWCSKLSRENNPSVFVFVTIETQQQRRLKRLPCAKLHSNLLRHEVTIANTRNIKGLTCKNSTISASEYLKLHYRDEHFNLTKIYDVLDCGFDDRENVEKEICDAVVDLLTDDEASPELRAFTKKLLIVSSRVTYI